MPSAPTFGLSAKAGRLQEERDQRKTIKALGKFQARGGIDPEEVTRDPPDQFLKRHALYLKTELTRKITSQGVSSPSKPAGAPDDGQMLFDEKMKFGACIDVLHSQIQELEL